MALLSFRRIVDIPFQICVAALENWQRTGPHGELHIDNNRLCTHRHQHCPGWSTVQIGD